MRIPTTKVPFFRPRSEKREAYQRLPNLNLLPLELARPLLTPLALVLLILLLVDVAFIFFLQAQARSQEERNAFLKVQLVALNSNLQEALKVQEEAAKLKEKIAILEELPRAYVQLERTFDLSVLTGKLLEKAPPGLKITSLRGKETSVNLEGKAAPEVAVDYYRQLRTLDLFSSMIIKFLTHPEKDLEGSFSIDFTVKGAGR